MSSEAGPSRVRAGDRPQLGHLAAWSVSSHKYGFGVDNLRDGNEGTFWQSEGPQPHLIDLSFPKRVLISAVALLTSHPKDDSYTPSKIAVRCGTTVHDLQEVRSCEFSTPDGWQHIALRPMDSSGQEVEGPPISAYHLRISIIANHLNGKDTHVRGLRVYGVPSSSMALGGGDAAEGEAEMVRMDAHLEGNLDEPGSDMVRGEQRQIGEREKEGRRLLGLGNDGRKGFSSRAFKMHEFIR